MLIAAVVVVTHALYLVLAAPCDARYLAGQLVDMPPHQICAAA
jgi:hypothetical protein